MADRARRLLIAAAGLTAILAAALTPTAGWAHALKVFALVDGQKIKGSVYFSGGTPARAAQIVVRDPNGNLLAEAVSGDDGTFTVPSGSPVDHRITADAGDGHRATFIVRAAEFATGETSAAPAGEAPRSMAPEARAAAESQGAAGAGELEAVVESVVSRHVTPLREQLNAYEDRLRWHDILGGIGYILGLTGLAALFAARRRNHRAPR